MNSIIQLVIYSLVIGSIYCEENIECNKESSDKLDDSIRELSIFGDPNGVFPVTQTESSIHCQKEKQTLKWIRLYVNKCLTGMSLQLISLTIDDLDNVIKKYCDSPKLNKIYTSWGGCGNSALNQTVKCWDSYVLAIERVNIEKSNIEASDIVALTCCDYYIFDHCVEESYYNVGKKICPIASAEGLHSLLNEVSGSALQYLCGEYQADNDKCDSLLERFKYLNNVKLNKPLSKSPIGSMIKILDNTPDVSQFMFRNDTTLNN